MGGMPTLERVLQSLCIVVNEENSVLEEIVEASVKEEGGKQVQDVEKIEGQECEHPCGAKGMKISLFWMSFPTVDGVHILNDNVMGQQLNSKTSIPNFNFVPLFSRSKCFKYEYVLNIVAFITPLLIIIFFILLFIGTVQFTVPGEDPLE